MAPKKNEKVAGKPNKHIRIFYLYLLSAITIIMILVSCVQIVRIGLDAYVLKVEQPAYWYNECLDPKPSMNGTTTVERTAEEQVECEERSIKKAKEQLAQERRRDISQALAMLIVAFPLFLYHWGIIQKDHSTKK